MASLIFLIGFNWELQEFLAIIQQEREWRIFMAQHEKFYLNGTWQLKKRMKHCSARWRFRVRYFPG